jgi:hypothetical protein
LPAVIRKIEAVPKFIRLAIRTCEPVRVNDVPINDVIMAWLRGRNESNHYQNGRKKFRWEKRHIFLFLIG